MRLVAVSLLVLAAVITAAVVTKIVGHHTTCTVTSTGSGYAQSTARTSCTTHTGLW